jgi:predicted  nucleic acid-binding Zn-ribbon protein
MIKTWNNNITVTNNLQATVNKHQELIDQLNGRISETEKKIKGFALQSELEKTQRDVDELKGLAKTVSMQGKDIDWIKTELNKLIKAADKYVTYDEHNLLKTRVDQLEKQLKEFHRLLAALEKKIKGLSGQGGGADPEEIEKLHALLDLLRKEFEAHRD